MVTNGPILVIDDDDDTREALEVLLEMNGFTVIASSDGAQALARLHAGLRPCLILLDLMMPEKNGFEFRVEQLLDPELATIPVVIYSGAADAHSAGTVLGAVAHLSKPIDFDKLLETVKAHCHRRVPSAGAAPP